MPDENKSLRRAVRIYEAFLRVYPRSHRREYGPLMSQLFRDQYRAACRCRNRAALPGLWFGTLADLVRSAFREQLTEQTNPMKNMPPNKLSFILFIIAFGAGVLSCSFLVSQPPVALGLAYLCSLALFLRAVVEWRRPPNELIRSLVWGASIAVLMGLIVPVWARFNLHIIPSLIVIPIALNGIVPIVKVGLRIAGSRT